MSGETRTARELAHEYLMYACHCARDERRPHEKTCNDLTELLATVRNLALEEAANAVDSFYVEWPNSPTIAARIRAMKR